MSATPNAAGAADLKTYDVPDPPRPVGWKVRCLVAGFLALGVAAGGLRALRLPHLMWVVENHPTRYSSDTSVPYIADRLLDWLEADYDADTLRPYALELSDLKSRGRLHKVLVGSGDPAQLDAMMAYIRCLYSEEQKGEVVDSMLALDRGQAAARLVARYASPPENESESETSSLLGVTLQKVPPADLLPHVLKIADPARRGRFHATLATTKDPAQLDAVLAYASTVVPTSPGLSRPNEWEPLVASLGAFGPAATPKLEAVLEQTDSRSLVSLAAEALRTSDLPFLVARARKLLDDYDAGVFQLARDMQLLSELEATGSRPEGATDEILASARENVAAADAKAYMIFEVLRALDAIHGDQAVDFCIVRGLSTFNREIAEWSAMRIKERFTPDKLVDTLFSYIAQKTEFKVSEVDVYEGLMKELGTAGAARVAQNLDRLLDEAKGDPDEVFWLYKKMGFTLLGELGEPAAIPVLQKYTRDPGSYVLTTSDSSGRRTGQEEKKFAVVVREAIQAIEARANAPVEGE